MGIVTEFDLVRAENAELLSEVSRLKKSRLTEERVRRELLRLSNSPFRIPSWTLPKASVPHGLLGTATLFSSDQHFGEVVDPAQVYGLNRYSVAIAESRWRLMISKAIDLCFRHMVRPRYDGIVFALGGDGLSGDIHDELSVTNEMDTIPAALRLAELYAWAAKQLRKAFGRVLAVCVIGNHPRNTHKPRYKNAAYTSFDWMAYQIAKRECEGDKGIEWLIPPTLNARYRTYGSWNVLTHGNEFSGGDGIIGALGPVVRGDVKKRARSTQMKMAYDTLLVAHWHQLHMGQRVVMNGSMKGYDEYAVGHDFPPEPPQQALFVTHPRYGRTFSFPVRLDEPGTSLKSEWAVAA